MSDLLVEFEATADKLAAGAEREIAAVNGDDTLSPQGKAQRYQAINERYGGQVAPLQKRAADAVADRVVVVEGELKAARAAAAKADRELLTPAVAFALAEREIAATASEDLPALVEGSRDGWEWETLGRLAALELRRRVAAEPTDEAHRRASTHLQRLAAPPDPKLRALEDEVRTLRDSTWRIAKLDRRREAERIRQLIR